MSEATMRSAADETSRRVASLNMQLAYEDEIPNEIAEAAASLAASITEADKQAWLASDRDWGEEACRALADLDGAVTRRALGPEARDELRSAFARLGQSLGLIAMGREEFERLASKNYP